MKKRTLASAVAAALVCSMALSACGGGGGAATTTAAGTTVAATTAAAGGASGTTAEKVDTGRAGYDWIANNVPKLTDEKVTYKIAVQQETSQIDYNNIEFFKELEKATNVHIEFQCFPVSGYNEQKNLMLATGDYPDAFMGYACLSMADLNQYGPMGVFIPVEDLIAQYCPNYQKVLEDNPTLVGLSQAFDGHTYSWGDINDSPSRDWPDNLYINKTWLDNLGLEIPTTMEEYYNVLKAFKEQDANGNGDPNDEIPYTFFSYQHINGYGGFFGAYGEAEAFNAAGGTLNHFIVNDNDEVVYLPLTEEYKTAIRELRKFVTDGLWDRDGFVQTMDQYNGKLANPTPIVGSAYTWGPTSFAADCADQYVAITPLKATADSAPAKVHHRRNHISINATGFSITNKCKNTELLAQWVDLLYNDVISILAYQGIERITAIDEDGTVHYNEANEPDGTSFSTYVKNTNAFDGVPKNMSMTNRYEKMVMETVTDKKMEVTLSIYANQPQSLTLPSMNFTEEENQVINDIGKSCQTWVEQKQNEWLLNEGHDIDTEWDAYVEQLNKYNVQTFIDTMQQAYDRTIGK